MLRRHLPTAIALACVAALAPQSVAGLGATGTGVGAQAGCDEPYAPVYGYRSAGGRPTEQVWPDRSVSPVSFGNPLFDHQRRLADAGVDTDGDGQPDLVWVDVVGDEQVIVISRGDGEIRLGEPGHNLGELTSNPVGDLDADGRDEVLFLVRPATGGPDRHYVLPGTTAPGSHLPAEVGIEVPSYHVLPVGNLVDGPGDDLATALTTGVPGTAIVSGDALMAAGPGGTADFDGHGDPIDGFPVGVFDLGDPTVAVATITDGLEGGVAVTIELHRGATVTRFSSPAQHPLPQPPYRVAITEHLGRRLLEAAHNDRGGGVGFYWDIDEPCRSLPASGSGDAPAPAPRPANPRPASPSYTG